MVKFDDLLEEINGFGKYQKVRLGLICFTGILVPIVIYIHSFTAANPKHRCTHPGLVNDSYEINTLSFLNDTGIHLGQCSYKYNNTEQKCDSWVFDKTYYQSTLTEEWGMVCGRIFWRSNLQTILFCGVLIGSLILGVLADSFGRRPIILLSFGLITLAGFGAAFGPQTQTFGVKGSYIIYAICRFLIGVGSRGINTTGFVLALELVASDKRTFAGIVFQYFFPLGQMLLVVPVYFIRDWRTLNIIIAAFSVPFLLIFFILPESPRWLLSKHKKEKAHKILTHVAKVNKTRLDSELWTNFLAKETEENIPKEGFSKLIKSKVLVVITLTLIVHWIANNLMFYGVGLKSSDLGVNPYLSFAISAFVELLGLILAHLIIDRYGRKVPYGLSLILSGIACISIVFTKNRILIVSLAMLGKFFVSCSYGILYLYSSELFPTSVRSSCMGTCSMMARVGAMIAPQINAVGDIWEPFPFVVFGASGALVGLSTFLLPETLGHHLPRTIEESEKAHPLKCCK